MEDERFVPEETPAPEDRLDAPLPEKKQERSGEYLFRVLKPAGCIFVLVLFVLFLVACFTFRAPVA